VSPKRIPEGAVRRKWLAGPDGTAHCTGPFDRWRALCGATQVLGRLAWPEERRCRLCVALDAGVTAGVVRA